MKAAANSATLQYRRGATSPLQAADQTTRALGEYATPQESDISGDFGETDPSSPFSANSTGSSEKLLSPIDSNRGHSDISEGCPSPTNKDRGYMEDIDMVPTTKSPALQEPQSCENLNQMEYDDVELVESPDKDLGSEVHESLRSDSRKHEDDQDESDPKQMVDIVGDASSPGEFLDHALQFIKRGRKSEHDPWQGNDHKKSRSPEYEPDMPARKRHKPSDRQEVHHHGETFGAHVTEANREVKMEHQRYSLKERREYRESKPQYEHEFPQTRRQSSVFQPLTPDQKFFVEAFKREVAYAAENAAEASALRVLEILEGSGIFFGRSPFKQQQYETSSSERNRHSSSGSVDRQRPIASSSPGERTKHSSDNTGNKDCPHLISGTRLCEDKRGEIRTSNQSQLCFGSLRMNSVEYKEDVSNGTIDLTTNANGLPQRRSPEKSMTNQELKRSKDTIAEEQTQALSLVRKANLPDETDNTTISPAKMTSFAPKSGTSVTHAPLLDPFVRHSIAAAAKNPFVPPIPGFPISSSFGGQIDYASNPLSKFIPSNAKELIDKHLPGSREDRMSDRLIDYSPFSLAAANSLKNRTPLKSRVSPMYKDEKRISPRRDDKPRQDLLPTSLGLHGIPSSSAFRRHETQRSPTSAGMRALRSSGSPDRKPYQSPHALGMMYPFTGLPLFPPQTSHFAAVLAQMNRRHGQGDFTDMRNGTSNVSADRISMHQSLRGPPGSFIGDLGYDVDGSNYAFPNNMQEGLTPQHLKKAKLIFFYTRYPNANTLKTYFPDVKFTRAITSQLIKWFSNFREFFYIQMEKFARQAVTDGVIDASVLRVTRDSELFRVLNLHYNKCNEFYVPEAFINATEASLREFFNAVRAGKDTDPAWKKVIYKIICKLDSEIPEIFKSPSVLDRLHEIRD